MEFKQRKISKPDAHGSPSYSVKDHQPLAQSLSAHHCFYNRTPTGSITLQQFESYAVERLKVLKAIELNTILRGGKNTKSEEDSIESQLTSIGWRFLHSVPPSQKLHTEDEEKDFISHHILRLAYAKSESSRQWFVAQESELMNLRMKWNKDLIRHVLRQNGFDYRPVPTAEVEGIAEELNACRAGHPGVRIEYYKVDFEEVLPLVSKRRIYLSEGYAYLPDTDLHTFILNKYKMYLKEQLAVVCKHLPGLEEENRVVKQLKALSGGDMGASYNSLGKGSGDHITADMLDSMLHNHLKVKRHLKHDGRMQYGLFLKGIGVSLEESLKFWRLQFGKGGVDTEKFDKNYAYNIRHNYGKEGKRADYTPYSCMKIISRIEPKADECHGCPFKHSDVTSLRSLIAKRKISTEAMEEILALKKQGHFQVACMSLFKATHPESSSGLVEGLQHPNQYFKDSQAILNGDQDSNSQSKQNVKREARVKTEPPSRSTEEKENIRDLTTDEFDEDMEVTS